MHICTYNIRMTQIAPQSWTSYVNDYIKTIIFPLTHLCTKSCWVTGKKSNHMYIFIVILYIHYLIVLLWPKCFKICTVHVICGFRVTAPPSGQKLSLDDSTQWYSADLYQWVHCFILRWPWLDPKIILFILTQSHINKHDSVILFVHTFIFLWYLSVYFTFFLLKKKVVCGKRLEL